MRTLRIGVIGYSGRSFPIYKAHTLLTDVLYGLLKNKEYAKCSIELWSGMTDYGIPALAYAISDSLNSLYHELQPSYFPKIKKVGVAPKCAEELPHCVVDKKLFYGIVFGEESIPFLTCIDILIAVGGGRQTIDELALCRQMFPKKRVIEIPLESY